MQIGQSSGGGIIGHILQLLSLPTQHQQAIMGLTQMAASQNAQASAPTGGSSSPDAIAAYMAKPPDNAPSGIVGTMQDYMQNGVPPNAVYGVSGMP